MPIFEYQCQKCKHVFEKLLRKADEKVECPKCGGASPIKLISSFCAKTEAAALPCETGACCEPEASRHCCGGSCGCKH